MMKNTKKCKRNHCLDPLNIWIPTYKISVLNSRTISLNNEILTLNVQYLYKKKKTKKKGRALLVQNNLKQTNH